MLFKAILYAFLAYLVYLLIRFFSALNRAVRPSSPPKRLSGTMVKDEICNTYLPKEEALREIIGGQEFYFCSKECRRKFLKEREKTV